MSTSARTTLATSILLAAALGLSACGHKDGKDKPNQGPPEVGVVTVEPQATPLVTELPGRTNPYNISDVRPQVNGIVQARLFTEGSIVHAGQVLYRIDPATYRAAVAQARGQVANAEANLTTTRLRAERYADLVKINAVSKQDYDDAVAAFHQAQANVQQTRAALEQAQINLGYTNVKAPITGRIGRSTFTQGALVTANQTTALTTIQQLDPIYVDLSQSSAELLKLRRDLMAGQVHGGPVTARVKLVLEDGSTYPLEGRLEFTDVTVDPNSGTVDLRAVFPNPQNVLLPGMYVRAQVTQAVKPNAILVPQQAVARDPKGNATLFVVDAQGRAQIRPVQISQALGSYWMVNSGLAAGERVITEGLMKVKPGVPVRAVPAGSPASGAPGAPNGAAGASNMTPSQAQQNTAPQSSAH